MPIRAKKAAAVPAVQSVNTGAKQARSSASTDAPGGNAVSNKGTPNANLPNLPHEQDESVAATDGTPSAKVQQAYRDVTRGQQDTDRGAEANRTYAKLKQ